MLLSLRYARSYDVRSSSSYTSLCFPDECIPRPDIVGFLVFGVGEDHEDAVGRKIVHFPPEARADE